DRLGDVDRDGEADTLRVLAHGGVDADDVTAAVHERSTRVTRVHGGIGLDQVVQLLRALVTGIARGDLPSEARYDSGGHAVLERSQRIADGDCELPLLQARRNAELGDRKHSGITLHDRPGGPGGGAGS